MDARLPTDQPSNFNAHLTEFLVAEKHVNPKTGDLCAGSGHSPKLKPYVIGDQPKRSRVERVASDVRQIDAAHSQVKLALVGLTTLCLIGTVSYIFL